MIQSVRGTKDTLPEEIRKWHKIESVFRNVSEKFGYKELRTPIFEKTEVFSRSIGDGTDIVNKEMYTFTDRGEESLTLRPEMTAALVRAVIQNSLIQQSSTLRLWYFGPFFRYERPQKGRLRQFHQYGAECLGSQHPESDAEIILLAHELISTLEIKDYKLILNTLGSDESRKNYKNALIDYFSAHKEGLSADSRQRLEINPLRILDSKHPDDRQIVEAAPVILDSLDKESIEHFEQVKNMLTDRGIDIEINPRLVRGLDYYSHTVFEFQSSALGAQDSFGGGGRYNGLFGQLGGKDQPAVGFAMGVERLLLILEKMLQKDEIFREADLYLIAAGDSSRSSIVDLAHRIRRNGYSVLTDLQRRSIKAQMREANKMNVLYTVVIGDDELNTRQVNLKNMENGESIALTFESLQNYDFNK